MAAKSSQTGSASVYLIEEPHPLIAQDLAEMLGEIDDGRVIRVSRRADLDAAIAGEAHLTAAFLSACGQEDEILRIDRSLRARGAVIVLTENNEAAGRCRDLGWRVLDRPFTDDMVRTLLRRR